MSEPPTVLYNNTDIISKKICFNYDKVWKKEEGNVLFNDTLNTFYLWLYGVGTKFGVVFKDM